MNMNIALVDTSGDDVILCWSHVTHCEEIRTTDSFVPGGRRFLRTRVWLTSGKSVDVRERISEIREATGMFVYPGTPEPLKEWEGAS